MRVELTYKRILSISTPIMLGSAVQNVVALSDSVFLYHKSDPDFAAIGVVGIFYMVIAAIGYGFSKGGQIMIARRMGEGRVDQVGNTFYAMLFFELFLAVIMFLFMQYGTIYFFSLFIDAPEIYIKILYYLEYRSYGVFFSYTGLVMVALYTGLARTFFIIIDTLILASVNIFLNYALIFGKWGFPEMGIGGAGLASTIAEITAFLAFLIYTIRDKNTRAYQLFKLPDIAISTIRNQLKIASPIVAQAVVGMGSWFVFVISIENLGQRALEITNLGRIVYLILSIPTWGFSSGINTIVSNIIGQSQRNRVMLAVWKTAKMSLATTLILSLPVILFPKFMLFPLFGGSDLSLIEDSRLVLWVVLAILTMFSIGGIFFNGLAGTGATYYGLKLQTICAIGYLSYIHFIVYYTNAGLAFAWTAEIFYWIAIWLFSLLFLKSTKWHKVIV